MKPFKLIILIFLLTLWPLSIGQAGSFGYSLQTDAEPTKGSVYDSTRNTWDPVISKELFYDVAITALGPYPWFTPRDAVIFGGLPDPEGILTTGGGGPGGGNPCVTYPGLCVPVLEEKGFINY